MLDVDAFRRILVGVDELMAVRMRAELPDAMIACVRGVIACDTVDLTFYRADGVAGADPPAEVRMETIAVFVAQAAGYPLAAHTRSGNGLPRRSSTLVGEDGASAREFQLGMSVGRWSDAAYLTLRRAATDFTDDEVALAAVLRPRLTAAIVRTADEGLRIDSGPVALTEREDAVLALAAEGLIDHAIADRLGISERTVQKHLQNVYVKLRAPNRTVAVLRWDRMVHGR